VRLRLLGFLLICVVPFVLVWDLSAALLVFVRTDDSFSQLMVVPFVSAFLVYERREAIFSGVRFGWISGAVLLALGTSIVTAARFNFLHLSPANACVLFVLGIVLFWMGGFSLMFGTRAFRSACFPLLFLFFSVPIPEPLRSNVVYVLQKGSAVTAEAFFRLEGVPYLREGFVFSLPGAAIRVAEECSGIRSSLALLITTVLASHLFLRSTRRRLLLCAAVIPLTVLKNGLRIATLSTLAIYVNPGFLTGDLHRHGGIVFFLIGLVPMALLLMLLQRSENRASSLAITR